MNLIIIKIGGRGFMFKGFKKINCLLITMFLISGLMIGCSSDGSEDKVSNKQSKAEDIMI